MTEPHDAPEPGGPRLYRELAAWWPLLSAPADYAEEAAVLAPVLVGAGGPPAGTLLELGSGGGNLASHLAARFRTTLVDRAPGMLEVSRALVPSAEHVLGDMRTLRIPDRTFDRVLIHDAASYLATEEDVRRALATCAAHCRRDGGVLILPDHVRETFTEGTDHGGHDGVERGMRYLEWTRGPVPGGPGRQGEHGSAGYVVDYAFLLREADGSTRVVHDRHELGLFSRSEWTAWLDEAGFAPTSFRDRWGRIAFVGRRR